MLRVALHGVLGQVQRLGDVRLRASLAQQLHDLKLAWRQLVLLANLLAALLKASVIRALTGSPRNSANNHFVSWSRISKQNEDTSSSTNIKATTITASCSPPEYAGDIIDPMANGAV